MEVLLCAVEYSTKSPSSSLTPRGWAKHCRIQWQQLERGRGCQHVTVWVMYQSYDQSCDQSCDLTRLLVREG